MKLVIYFIIFLFLAINFSTIGPIKAEDGNLDIQYAEKTYGQIKDLVSEGCLVANYSHMKFIIITQLMRLGNIPDSTETTKLPSYIQDQMRELVTTQLYLSELKKYYKYKYGKPIDLHQCSLNE